MTQLNGDFDPKACYGWFGDPKTPQHSQLVRDMAALEGEMQKLEEAGAKAAAEGRAQRARQLKQAAEQASPIRKIFSRIAATAK